MDGGGSSAVHAVRPSARDPALLEHVKLARCAAIHSGRGSTDRGRDGGTDVRTSRTDRGMTVNIGFEAEVLAGRLRYSDDILNSSRFHDNSFENLVRRQTSWYDLHN